jgi:hypothetical protein
MAAGSGGLGLTLAWALNSQVCMGMLGWLQVLYTSYVPLLVLQHLIGAGHGKQRWTVPVLTCIVRATRFT